MKQKLDRVTIPLLEWYGENRRALPWRETRDPYRVWVSEIMLQQTRVAAVLGYYAAFLEEFPTVTALAGASEDRLLKRWQGLGYYARARNMQRAAQIIEERWGGQFPDTYEAIRALPGIGDYTAGAIASIAFGLPRAAVDGNVLRVVSRVTGLEESIDLPAVKGEVARALEAVMPIREPGRFNQALMELGATVCLPNGAPLCGECPLRGLCRARREGRTDVLPVRSPKRARRVEARQVYLLFREGRVALRRRPDRGLLAGLWELPNEPEGVPLPFPIPAPEFVGAARHIFTHIEWHMTGWMAQLPPGEPPALPSGWVWADREALREVYSVPSAFSGFMDAVYAHIS